MAKARKSTGGEVVHGIGVSPGVAVGHVFLVADHLLNVPELEIESDEVLSEICRVEDALIETRKQIKMIQEGLHGSMAAGDISLFDAHLMVLDDRSFIEEVIDGIKNKRRNAESIIKDVATKFASALSAVEDDYLRERVADIRDVARRLILNLTGNAESTLAGLPQKHIVVASDLAPSETATLRKDMVIAFATDLGSPTSHTALMARALEIPAIVGLRDISKRLSTGDEVLLDGNKGILIIHPSGEQLKEYGKVAKTRQNIQRDLVSLQHEPAETLDGHKIVLSANVEGIEEVDTVIQYGAEGIGLFRSEYLYLSSRDKIMDEDEQTRVYSRVATRLSPAPVIIRTLDLGGDKYLPDEQLVDEANPFLGCRSIRLSLMNPDNFKMQMKAILRASVKGNVKIMYPMISNVDEVIQANALLEEAKSELGAAGVPYKKNIEVGAMIEIPSAALTADIIAEHVDFFSLGTNDLIQYTLAVDRVNERVAYLYEPTHPAVLQLVRNTVKAGHRNNIWVGLCGSMASDPVIAPLLVGMGVDELSMPASAIPLVKDVIRSITLEHAQRLVEVSIGCKSGSEVLKHCRKLTKEVAPELLELI